jgi:hypothetical protein
MIEPSAGKFGEHRAIRPVLLVGHRHLPLGHHHTTRITTTITAAMLAPLRLMSGRRFDVNPRGRLSVFRHDFTVNPARSVANAPFAHRALEALRVGEGGEGLRTLLGF